VINVSEAEDSITFSVRVAPRASKSEIIGEVEGFLKVRISAPPVDGAANVEVVKILAKAFGVAKANIEILSGQTSKTKRIRIDGVTAQKAQELFGE
jgi:uncharacterized protein